jgi:UDP-N-acetylmuramoyl-tripeptide--D-alanyl-D-alanine ligase
MNSLGVLLAVRALGADAVAAARTFSRLAPLKGRGARARVRLAPRGRGAEAGAFLLIDESYNASPASTEAAIAVLGRADPGQQGRRIAVLGDMLELGPASQDLHLGLKDALLAAEVDLVFAAGPMMTRLAKALPAAMRGAVARDSATLAPLLAEAVRPGDVIMVKGSLGSRMAVVIEALEALGEQRQAAAPAARRARAAGRPKAANGT